jgi:hypothetical protein
MPIQRSLPLLAASLFLLPGGIFAQTTGVSHPEDLDDPIAAAPAQQDHYVKPSPAVLPQDGQRTAPALQQRSMPDGSTPTFRVLGPPRALGNDDPNAGVVIDVPLSPNELAIGTRIQTALHTPISTRITPVGTGFSTILAEDIVRDGHVLVPAGTQIVGRISQIHGGRRLGGNASIRLQPESLLLPDGSQYHLRAQVVAIGEDIDSHLNAEGTILANSHTKTTAIIGGATTATAVITGAMIGGGVGAVVGLGIGAGAGTILWLRQDRQEMLREGTEITFALDAPLTLSHAVYTSSLR